MGYLSPPPMPAPVVVYKDVGGLVTDYQAQTEQYRRENREVRLHECRSACTLALSLPNVCVYPDAKIKFHQAYNAITREVDLGVSDQLWSSYPSSVRARLGYLTREYRVLSGLELISMGMRNCNGDNPVLIAKRGDRSATRVASARPTPRPGSDSFGDLAQRVQTAVASAFSSGAPEQPAPPIRVMVAARQPVASPPMAVMPPVPRTVPLPPSRPDFSDQSEGSMAVASAAPELVEAPLPPRRPPSEAFTSADAQREIPSPDASMQASLAYGDQGNSAYRQIINGAQPILSGSFERIRGAESEPVRLLVRIK